MTLAEEPVRARDRRGVRSWSIAVVVAGAVLVPAAPALADHMPGMTNGTMCPHASGEGPDSLAAAGPGESGGPARAPSEQPITAPGATTAAPAPAPAAKPVTNTSRPASQVTQPAKTQVQVQQPATSVAQSAPARAVAQTAEPVTARTTVAAPVKAQTPKAGRSAPRAHRAARPTFERRFNGLEPRVASGSALPDPVADAPKRATPSAPAPSAPLLLLFGLATIAAIGAAIAVGRRAGGTDEVPAIEPVTPPVAPTYAELSLEAELHEIVAEAKARALLGDTPGEREPANAP